MWFGESEKRIKEIFTNYKTLCKNEGLKPILLFNEADAIFGKRKEGNASNVDQTENTIQNIILEEMEKLEGILIATTNLNQNLDVAFERRFLYKVKFENPSLEAKQKIWMSKLEILTDVDAMKLATDYSFSGGEIENIVRKVTIEEVLNGERPHLQQLIEHCNNEKFASRSTSKRLGF
jgi:SpoVK/Ycf46/Vps4 family AAA+-type ATPase